MQISCSTHWAVFNGMLLEFSPLLHLQPAAELNLITTFTCGDKFEVGRWRVYDVRQLICRCGQSQVSYWRGGQTDGRTDGRLFSFIDTLVLQCRYIQLYTGIFMRLQRIVDSTCSSFALHLDDARKSAVPLDLIPYYRGGGKEGRGGGGLDPLKLTQYFRKDRNTLIERSASNIVYRNRPTLSLLHADGW